jgi:ankyrin repeat protein
MTLGGRHCIWCREEDMWKSLACVLSMARMWRPGGEDELAPLHLASRRGHAELAGMFLERRAAVMVQDKEGSTPLHLASRWGRVEATHMLLERGASVNVQEEVGSTPLLRRPFGATQK